MKRTVTAGSKFDPDFYRKRYPDLRGMTPAQAQAHYETYGRAEGRRPSADARFEDSLLAADLPELFSPGEYKRLNPDVAAASIDDWDVCLHYLRHGRGENRAFTELDAEFYWRLYLFDTSFSRRAVGVHFREHEGQAGVYRSLDAMLEAHDVEGRAWLDVFSDRAFSLLNFAWLGEMLEGPRALRRFLEDGLQRLAPISFTTRFDLAFYREIHPLLASAPSEQAYRHWLFKGLQHHEPGDGAAWLKAEGLGLSEYPKAFAWREYAAARLDAKSAPSRWTALSHLVSHPEVAPASWPILPEGAGAFLISMAKMRLGRGEHQVALACVDRAVAMGVLAPELHHIRGDICHRLGLWAEAASHYQTFHSYGRSTLWSIVLAAECLAKAGDPDGALNILLVGEAYRGDQPWLSMLETVVSTKFENASLEARALYADDQRARGDAVLEANVDQIKETWSRALDLPAPLPERKRKVVILANQSLPQCTHYRVEQKHFLLEAAAFECKIFDWSQTEEFLAALPDACAAIFYRVPAFPSVVKAILAARSQGVTTYYEIDDLIFDPENYPDPFESFQGQISWQVYQGLIYGTTLYRSAMRLCDFGIASTTPLAMALEKEVRERRCFVVRNGLDLRNLGMDAPFSAKQKADGRVRIVYGSATLAHNQDFHDMAGDALRAVMTRHPGVELCIIGHLDLGDAFDAYGDRVIQVELLRDPQAYWALLADCDINLAVLAPSRMADCKSEIKWLEAAVLGIPSVLSATSTYREVVEEGVTGMLASTPEEWEKHLESLVSNPAIRLQIGQNARRAALQHYSIEAGSKAIQSAMAPASEKLGRKGRKRVLLVNVFFPPQSIGGATRVVADNLGHMLDADLFDFAVAATDHDARPAYRRRNDSFRGVPVYRIAAPFEDNLDWKTADEKMAEWFEEILEQFEPDLVHFHCVQRLTVSIVDVCTALNIPYIVSAHDGWWLSDYQFLFDEKGRVRTPGDELIYGPRPPVALTETLHRLGRLRHALDGAQRILAPSQRFAELYRQAGFRRAEGLSNGISDVPVLASRPSETGRVRLAHIGDTSPHKGFDLVEAVLRQGSYENLELLALSHGRSQDDVSEDLWGRTPVCLRGRVPQNRIAELYAEVDVLLAPSAWTESFGLVTREANAAGVWVVASDRGAIGEDVRPGIDGFVVDVSSPEALAAVLQEINDNPSRYLEAAPRNPAVEPSRRQAERLLEIYEELLSGARSSVADEPPVNSA